MVCVLYSPRDMNSSKEVGACPEAAAAVVKIDAIVLVDSVGSYVLVLAVFMFGWL